MKSVKEWAEEIAEQAKYLRNVLENGGIDAMNTIMCGFSQKHMEFAANHLDNFARAMLAENATEQKMAGELG